MKDSAAMGGLLLVQVLAVEVGDLAPGESIQHLHRLMHDQPGKYDDLNLNASDHDLDARRFSQ